MWACGFYHSAHRTPILVIRGLIRDCTLVCRLRLELGGSRCPSYLYENVVKVGDFAQDGGTVGTRVLLCEQSLCRLFCIWATRGYQEMVECCFGYGESEYEVSFGLAPRNGDLSPPVPETPEPFNSPFRARNPERGSDSNSPHIYPEIKGRWVIQFCFSLSCVSTPTNGL